MITFWIGWICILTASVVSHRAFLPDELVVDDEMGSVAVLVRYSVPFLNFQLQGLWRDCEPVRQFHYPIRRIGRGARRCKEDHGRFLRVP